MKSQNCIQVKHINHLSLPYLVRFFGSAGQVVKIDKDESSRYVTIEFANKFAVEKALRFDGRVLDKQPIRIKKCRQKQVQNFLCESNTTKTTASKLQAIPFSELLKSQGSNKGSSKFKQELWSIVFAEIKKAELQGNQGFIIALLIWVFADFEMKCIKHFKTFKCNPRSNYLIFEIEKQIIERLTKRIGTSILSRPSTVEFTNGLAKIWFAVPYPNIQEGSLFSTIEQSKIEAYSNQHKCIQLTVNRFPISSEIMKSLAAYALHLPTEQDCTSDLLSLEFHNQTTEQDNYFGIVQNIGIKDLFHYLQSYEQPNSCLYLWQKDTHPELFACSLRLVGCRQLSVDQKRWCDLYEAVVWKRWTGEDKFYYEIEKKMQISQLNFGQHNIFFENAQFSLLSMSYNYKRYIQLHRNSDCKVFYVRKQVQPASQTCQKQQADSQNIDIENQIGSKLSGDAVIQEEIVLSLILIEIRAQGASSLNQLKLEHYLEEYIDESINGKGLIIASKEMAYKLAANIIEREKTERLFEFAHPKYEKHIGQEIWRLYTHQNQRKLKANLTNYQLKK